MTLLTAQSRTAPPSPPSRPPRRTRHRRRLRRYPAWMPYALIAPHLILFLAFFAYPFFSGIALSVFDTDFLTNELTFIGAQNFTDLFSSDGLYSELFWRTLGNTLLFVAVSTPVLVAGGLALAVFLNRTFRGRLVIRSVVIFPWTLSVTVASLIWWNLLNQSAGFFPKVIDGLGGQSPVWLSSQPWAWISIVATTLWWTVGFNVIIFLAGLQNVRQDLLEAATLDGASNWQRFRYVTFPSLRPVFLLVVTLQIIGGFNMVGQAQLLTGGGPPPYTTTTVMMLIYQVGFQGQFQISPAAAMSVIVAITIVLVSVANYFVTRRGDRE